PCSGPSGFDLIANDPCLSIVKMLRAKSHSMGSMASSTPDFLDFQRVNADESLSLSKFPKDFIFGVGSATYQ
ncbi:hypothetical protein Dimus_001352, partial [Dionaea muscipula]